MGEKFDRKSNLTPGGPGRPKGQRNYATIYREALVKIAEANNKSPEEIEEMMHQVGLNKALKGDYAFYRDINDRLHGRPQQKIDHTTDGKELPTPIMSINVSGDDSDKENSEPHQED